MTGRLVQHPRTAKRWEQSLEGKSFLHSSYITQTSLGCAAVRGAAGLANAFLSVPHGVKCRHVWLAGGARWLNSCPGSPGLCSQPLPSGLW